MVGTLVPAATAPYFPEEDVACFEGAAILTAAPIDHRSFVSGRRPFRRHGPQLSRQR